MNRGIKKDLVIITDNYPLTVGEFFLDGEMRVIQSAYDRIYVVTTANKGNKVNHFVPSNAQIIPVKIHISILEKLSFPGFIFNRDLRNELRLSSRTSSARFFNRFKVAVMDLIKAKKLALQMEEIIQKESISFDNTIFYSYWNDFKSLALALLKQKNKDARCISRAHGWDVFQERHVIPYLPFKHFILNTLDATFSVSEAGKMVLEKYLESGNEWKLNISRLGTSRLEDRSKEKQDVMVICSCANLIPLKRVDLIVKSLKELRDISIRWIHFGDGPEKINIQSLVEDLPDNIEVEFRGIVENNEVHEFYTRHYVDLFISLSSSEGIPVSFMEAMSYGIPVLSTDVGGIQEIVNEENGLIIGSDPSVESISAEIYRYRNLSTEEQQQKRRNAAETWKKKYSSAINYSDFAEQISEL